MAGLVPAIHALLVSASRKDVDARDQRGHDGGNCNRTCLKPAVYHPHDRRCRFHARAHRDRRGQSRGASGAVCNAYRNDHLRHRRPRRVGTSPGRDWCARHRFARAVRHHAALDRDRILERGDRVHHHALRRRSDGRGFSGKCARHQIGADHLVDRGLWSAFATSRPSASRAISSRCWRSSRPAGQRSTFISTC